APHLRRPRGRRLHGRPHHLRLRHRRHRRGHVRTDSAERRRHQIRERPHGLTTMAIIINIDVMLAKRKMSVTELAEKVGIPIANISVLKNGKAKAIRLSTLEAICKALECQPGDVLEYRKLASAVPK